MAAQLRLLAVACMLLMPACGMPGQTEDPNEEFWGDYYGTAKSEDDKEKDWWDGFFGTAKPKQDAACGFYGTCKTPKNDSCSFYGTCPQ